MVVTDRLSICACTRVKNERLAVLEQRERELDGADVTIEESK